MLGLSPAAAITLRPTVNNLLAIRPSVQTNEASILLIGERFWR